MTNRFRSVIAIAASSMLTASSLASVTAFAATTSPDPAVAALANQIVSLSAKVNSDTTVKAEAAPIIQAVSSASFDWNMAIFGTDALTPTQQGVAGALTPVLSQLASFSITSQSTAVTLIDGIVSDVQAVNPSITTDDVVSLLNSIESNVLFGLVPLVKQSGLTQAQLVAKVETGLHTEIAAAVGAAPSSLQQLFGMTSGGSTGSSGGSTSSGTDGTSTSTGSGSTSGSTSGGTSGSGSGGSTSKSGSGGTSGGSTSTSGSTSTGSSSGGPTKPPAGPGTVVVGTGKMGTGGSEGIYINGTFAIGAPEVKSNGHVFMSLASTIRLLQADHMTSHWNGQAWKITSPATTKINWSHVKPVGTGKVGIYLNGHLVLRTNALVKTDAKTKVSTSYLSVGAIIPVLREIGFTVTWNGTQMNIVPPTTK